MAASWSLLQPECGMPKSSFPQGPTPDLEEISGGQCTDQHAFPWMARLSEYRLGDICSLTFNNSLLCRDCENCFCGGSLITKVQSPIEYYFKIKSASVAIVSTPDNVMIIVVGGSFINTWHLTPDTWHLTPDFFTGATIRTRWEIQCLPYAGGFFFYIPYQQVLSVWCFWYIGAIISVCDGQIIKDIPYAELLIIFFFYFSWHIFSVHIVI